MANIKADAILRRIRQILLYKTGYTLRHIADGRFQGDLPEGLDVSEDIRRAMSNARVEATITSISRSRASPPIFGNVLLYDIGVDVRVARTVTTLEQLSDDDRVTLQALSVADADYIRQALEYPDNLGGTSGMVVGVGGSYATGFTGGETLTLTVDGTSVSVTFSASDQSVTQAGVKIATAMSGAGVGDGVNSSAAGQLVIFSQTAGTSSSVVITGGTGAATLGLTGLSSTGVATDLVSGLLSYQRSRFSPLRGSINDGAQLLESIHSFSGVAIARPATS